MHRIKFMCSLPLLVLFLSILRHLPNKALMKKGIIKDVCFLLQRFKAAPLTSFLFLLASRYIMYDSEMKFLLLQSARGHCWLTCTLISMCNNEGGSVLGGGQPGERSDAA